MKPIETESTDQNFSQPRLIEEVKEKQEFTYRPIQINLTEDNTQLANNKQHQDLLKTLQELTKSSMFD